MSTGILTVKWNSIYERSNIVAKSYRINKFCFLFGHKKLGVRLKNRPTLKRIYLKYTHFS